MKKLKIKVETDQLYPKFEVYCLTFDPRTPDPPVT
jgi:hypothetical protein